MATNVEIKARVTDLEALQTRIEAVCEQPVELIIQEDVFFHTPKGRLKLRILSDERGELIYYEREDRKGPKRSEYFISVTAEPRTQLQVLVRSLGVRGIVHKQRWLYWVENTRIHLDVVEGLGSFMELEVVLPSGQSTDVGEKIATELMAELGIDESELVKGAYIDLLEGSVGG